MHNPEVVRYSRIPHEVTIAFASLNPIILDIRSRRDNAEASKALTDNLFELLSLTENPDYTFKIVDAYIDEPVRDTLYALAGYILTIREDRALLLIIKASINKRIKLLNKPSA